MPKEKIQAFVTPEIAERFSKIARINGWAPGELVSRLLLFYVKASSLARAFDVQHCSDDVLRVLRQDNETGEIDVWEDVDEAFLALIEKLQEGLTPEDCFGGQLDGEGGEDE